MKKINIIISFLILITLGASWLLFSSFEDILHQNKIVYSKYSVNSFSGVWNYEFNSTENELLNRSFVLKLIEANGNIKGQYCAVSRGGRKIDCENETVYNIHGKIKNNIAYVNFTGFYDTKAKGKAKLYIDKNNLIWEILNSEGEIFAPLKASLIKKESFSVKETYVLKSCEQSRFKIKLEKTDDKYLFYVLDGKKIISNGDVILDGKKTQIKLNKMEGTFSNNKIVIQNYVDSNKKDSNFTQCSEKYLVFEKQ